MFDFGGAGVDVFFLLSRFIILFIYQRDLGSPGQFSAYVAKRLVRVCPMYWLVTTVMQKYLRRFVPRGMRAG